MAWERDNTEITRIKNTVDAATTQGVLVKTVNNQTPDASGNVRITVDTSASIGTMIIDATITTSQWDETNAPPYTYTITDSRITDLMDGTETTWLDDPTTMLGETTFTIPTGGGSIEVSTTVKPTATWGLHIKLLTDGSNILDEVNGKVDKTDIVNVLTDPSASKVLSAAMGKKLSEEKVNYTDIVSVLDSSASDKALSASAGKVLNDKILDVIYIQGNLQSTISIPAGSSVQIADRIKLENFYSSITVGSIPANKELVGIAYAWSTAASKVVPVDVIVWDDHTFSLYLANFSTGNVSISSIRFMTLWK